MNNIKKARKSRNMTQAALAEAVGVSQGNLSAWENGRWEPETATLKKLCEVLDCSADFLLARQAVPYYSESVAARPVSNIYLHLAKEMESMQLPEADVEKILDFARYMKEKNDQIDK